jgi:hypothetical protein
MRTTEATTLLGMQQWCCEPVVKCELERVVHQFVEPGSWPMAVTDGRVITRLGWNWPDELPGEVASAAIVEPSRRPRSQVPEAVCQRV